MTSLNERQLKWCRENIPSFRASEAAAARLRKTQEKDPLRQELIRRQGFSGSVISEGGQGTGDV